MSENDLENRNAALSEQTLLKSSLLIEFHLYRCRQILDVIAVTLNEAGTMRSSVATNDTYPYLRSVC